MVEKTKKTRIKRGKSISLSPWLLKRAEELVDRKEFSSVSDVTSTALSQFFAIYDSQERSEKHLRDMLQHAPAKYAVVIDKISGRIETAEDARKRLNIPEPPELADQKI